MSLPSTTISNDTHNTQDAPNSRPNVERPATFRRLTSSHNALQADTGAFILGLLLDIIKKVMQQMTQPITYIIVGYIIVVMLSYTSSFVVSTIVQGLSPICAMPLLSMVPICGKLPKLKTSIQEPRYLDLVELQMRFESVMESAGLGTNLALDMKESEMAVRDLNIVVKLSDLVSKDGLAKLLDEFVVSAREAGRELSRLESRVGGAVDSILAMDDYAIKSLEAIERHEKTRSVMSAVVYPFSASPASRTKLIETFNQAAALMETNLHRLITGSAATIVILSQLEEQLMRIHEAVSREEGDTKLRRDEILADLWTYLGANRAQLANFAGHYALLSQVASHRNAAAQQVAGTLVQLEKLAADLDDLRERVATPLVSHESSIPLEIHLTTLRKGVERLNESRSRARSKEKQILKRILDGPQYPELGSQ